MPGPERMPPRGEDFEIDRLNRHNPETAPERHPPPQRKPPEERVGRNLGRTALRDNVERPPDHER